MVLERLKSWLRLNVRRHEHGRCSACGADAQYGGKVCPGCLKTARRAAREESGRPKGPRGSYATLQGFIVQSEGEATVADHLFKRGLLFQYEPHVGPYRPDFLLPSERVIIEYYGMSSRDYNARRRKKEVYYAERGYRVIAVKRQDLGRLGEVLKEFGETPPGLKAELKRQTRK